MIEREKAIFPIADAVIAEVLSQLQWNEAGLIPAIAQQHDSGDVLMLAWMNEAAVRETLQTGRVCYWSRSRQSLWRKGESSSHIQRLVTFRYDCDADTLLLLVDQTGPACHTNRHSCFYREVGEQAVVDIYPVTDTEPDGA